MILTNSPLAETLFLILVIISHSSVLQRQQKINFNKLEIQKYVTIQDSLQIALTMSCLKLTGIE